jgi:hypothetical protein
MASKIDTTPSGTRNRTLSLSPSQVDTSGARDKPLIVGASGPIRVSTFMDQLLAEPKAGLRRSVLSPHRLTAVSTFVPPRLRIPRCTVRVPRRLTLEADFGELSQSPVPLRRVPQFQRMRQAIYRVGSSS